MCLSLQRWQQQSGFVNLANVSEQYSLLLGSTFCLQPPGDTLTRKGMYESILLGCIPVVFRSDAAFKSQLAFTSIVQYDDMWVYLDGDALLNGSLDVVAALESISHEVIMAKRAAMRSWGRRLAYAATSSFDGGYNDAEQPVGAAPSPLLRRSLAAPTGTSAHANLLLLSCLAHIAPSVAHSMV